MRIVTMGVYGYTAESFRAALERADADVFVDTRRRRGVRGHQYAFANSQRLQDLLADIGITYVHRINLAPTLDVIHAQDQADRDAGILRRDRDHLPDAFKKTYRQDVLDHLDSHAFLESLGTPESILLFCVERTPDACHRSLLAARLAQDLGADVEHITP
jgi:uncharacterized protein (DUF488 family)